MLLAADRLLQQGFRERRQAAMLWPFRLIFKRLNLTRRSTERTSKAIHTQQHTQGGTAPLNFNNDSNMCPRPWQLHSFTDSHHHPLCGFAPLPTPLSAASQGSPSP